VTLANVSGYHAKVWSVEAFVKIRSIFGLKVFKETFSKY
jgi:hypothetical protein